MIELRAITDKELLSMEIKYDDVRNEAVDEINSLKRQYQEQALNIRRLSEDNSRKDQGLRDLQFNINNEFAKNNQLALEINNWRQQYNQKELEAQNLKQGLERQTIEFEKIHQGG